MSGLWAARSVAIVGASDRSGSIGRRPVEALRRFGYRGRIIPVNPNRDDMLGLPCYASVAAAPGPIDLALIVVSADKSLAAIDDCVAASVPLAIVGASGFAESGNADLQVELLRRARNGNVRIVGPNCIGAVCAANRQVVSFSPLFDSPAVDLIPGNLGFVTQSGALGYGTVSLAYERQLGLGWVVNTGNEVDVTTVEVLTALAELDECHALLAYVETMTDGDAWRRLAALGKPIAVLKAGSSEAGAKAAVSHTGALAASDRVVDDVLGQFGVARARDVDELLDIGEAFATGRRPAGRQVAVVTTSGGSGILAADEIVKTGLELAALSASTADALTRAIPAFGSSANPVDVTAAVMSDRTLFRRCLDLVAADPAADALVACFCVLTGDDADATVETLRDIAGRHRKPIIVARTGAEFLAPAAREALRAAGIPCYRTPAQAVRALAALSLGPVTRAEHRLKGPFNRKPAQQGTLEANLLVQGPLQPTAAEPELTARLRRAGLPVPDGRVVGDARAAEEAVRDIGGRAVLKAVVPGLIHKTEAGGVVLDVTPATAASAYARIADLGGQVYVEQMIDGGAEVLVGVAPTPLGQVITLASGGVLAEVIDDAVFRLLAIDRDEAYAMIAQLRGGPVLRGARGRAPLDIDALAYLLAQVSDLVNGWPAGYELDLNPVAVLSDGVMILDAALSSGKQAP